MSLPTPKGALVAIVAAAFAGCVTTPNDDHMGNGMGDDGHMDDAGDHMDGGMHADESGNLPYTGQEDVLWTVTAGGTEEFRFEPANLTVPEGARVGVTFVNEGALAHEITLQAFAFHLHAEASKTLQGSFVAAEEGAYTFGCYIPGHFEAGMKGTLTVNPGSG